MVWPGYFDSPPVTPPVIEEPECNIKICMEITDADPVCPYEINQTEIVHELSTGRIGLQFVSTHVDDYADTPTLDELKAHVCQLK